MSRNRNVRMKVDNAKISNANILVSRNADQRLWRNSHNKLDNFNNEFSGQLSNGKSSSSSSLSWADDCEIDATKLVKEEYERMLRVLQRLEPIPSNYDKEEYKLWIKTFPCLSLTDRYSASSTKTLTNWNHTDSISVANNDELEYSCTIPKTIEPEKLLRSRSIRNKTSYNNRQINTTLNPMTLEEDLFSFLTISIRPETRTNTRNKQFGIEDSKLNYLPPLLINNASSDNNNNHRYKRKSSAYRKIDSCHILPVLETECNGKFRSTSAVPREFLHVSKCPSAFSINNRELDGKKLLQDAPFGSKQRKRNRDTDKKIVNDFAGFN